MLVKTDNRLSWVICISTFWILLFLNGVIRSSGIFFTSTVELWGLTRREIAWPFSLCTALDGFGVFLTGLSSQTFVVQKGVPIAVLAFFTGFALSSLTRNIPALIFLIGVVCGLSQGYVTGSSFNLICRYFLRYRTIAAGITYSGPSIGSILLPYLFNYLISEYGLNSSYLIISSLSLQAMIGAMVCRCISLERRHAADKRAYVQCLEKNCNHEELNGLKAADNKLEEQNTLTQQVTEISTNDEGDHFESKTYVFISQIKEKLSVLMHPMFYIYAFSFGINNFCLWSMIIIIVDLGKDIGLTQAEATYSLSILSLSDLCGRVMFGWFIDFGRIKRKYALTALCLIMSANCSMIPLAYNTVTLYILSGIYGFFSGCFVPNRVTVPAEYFGLKKTPPVFAITGLLMTCISLIRPSLIGYFRDGNGSYNALFFTLGGLYLFGGIMWMLEPIAVRCNKRYNQQQQNEINFSTSKA